MGFFTWLRQRTGSRKQRLPSRFRPTLEMLEDRAVPATLTVNTTLDVLGHDNGMLSLRQAIIDTNGSSTANTISLPAGMYTLTLAGTGENNCLTGDLDIMTSSKGSLTITGAGAGLTVVDGNSLDRVFQVLSGTVTLSGMTIQGGNAQNNPFDTSTYHGEGGGIENNGMLTINNCTISGNAAGTHGGGIFNYGGTVTVNNSTLSGNSALLGNGGGIANLASGMLTVRDSTISGNHAGLNGGGVENLGATLTFDHSVLSGNDAALSGGGIYNSRTLTVTVSYGTFTGNSANGGGGMSVGSGTVTVNYSTFSDNTAGVGGAISNGGTLTVSNSTFTGNSASNFGGAISNGGTLTVSNSTISGNSASNFGGGTYNYAGKVTLRGSKLLGNSAPLGADLYNLGTESVDSASTIGVRYDG